MVSLVSVKNDPSLFHIAAGAKSLLQLVGEHSQKCLVFGGPVGFDYGQLSTGMMCLKPHHEMFRLSVNVFENVLEGQVLTFHGLPSNSSMQIRVWSRDGASELGMEELLTLILNLAGTFAFGLSGGILAVRKQMDLFGVLVLSVVTGLGGGIMRDLLLGHAPPGTLSDWRYLSAAAVAGTLVFMWYGRVVHHGRLITAFDAVGLSVFTVTGTTIGLSAGLTPVPAALVGMLTGVGGGVLRDVLAAEVPLILRSEIYAVASLLGAMVIIVANQAQVLGTSVEIVAAGATFALRMLSVRRGWRIPVATPK